MNVLMLSVGHLTYNGIYNSAIERHLDYCDSIKGNIYILYFDKNKNKKVEVFHNRLFLINCGTTNKFLYPLFAFIKYLILTRNLKFSLIYTQDPFITGLLGIIFRKLSKTPVIIGSHASMINNKYWLSERPVTNLILNFLSKKIIPHADKLKTVSKDEKNVYTNELNIPENKIFVKNTPLKLEKFSRKVDESEIIHFRNEKKIKDTDTVLLWIGKVCYQKQFYWLISVFSELLKKDINLKLLIITSYTNEVKNGEKYISKLSEDISKNIIWEKSGVENNKIPLYYKAADIYVQTSLYEGLSKTVLEASASGIPVISSNVSGVNESILHGKTGFVYSINEKKELIQYVLVLSQNRKLRKEMGLNASYHVSKNFNYHDSVSFITGNWIMTCK